MIGCNPFWSAIAGLGAASGPSPSLDLLFTSGTLDSRVTYSGASLATLTDATGAIAYKPHNLLTYSEAFDNAAWTQTNLTVTANAAADPNGSTTMDLLVESASSATHIIRRDYTFTAGVFTASVYAKQGPGAARNVGLIFNTAGLGALFNATTGAVVVNSGATASATNIGGGIWRFSITATLSSGTDNVRIYLGSGTNWLAPWTGDGTSGIYLWGAQLNIGPLQPYYPTTSAAYYGPRFTYDPVTHAALGLLIEEQRTNLLLNSLLNGGASGSPGTAPTSWAFAFNGGTTTVSAGPLSGSSVTLAVGGAGRHNIAQSFVLTPSTTYTLSFNLTAVSGTAGDWVVLLNVPSGSISGTSFLTVSAGTGAKSLTFAAGAGGATIDVRIGCGTNANSTGAMSVTFDSLQLEAGAFATTYIPTTSASVTRAADSATMTGSNFSSWFNAAQGTFVADATYVPGASGAAAMVVFSANNASANGYMTYKGSLSGSITPIYDAGTLANVLAALPGGNRVKYAMTYSATSDTACANGGAISSAATISVATPIQMQIGRAVAGYLFTGTISRLRYYNTALTNAQLQALTA